MHIKSALVSVAALVAVLIAAPFAWSYDGDEGERRLESVVRRILGGASILRDLVSGEAVDDFRDRARELERAIHGDRRGQVTDGWRRLRDTFARAKREGLREARDPRVEFVIRHLEEDVTAGDRLVGRGEIEPGPGGRLEHVSLVENQVCVGWNRVGPHPCPSPRHELNFRLPRDATRVRRVAGEWRDFGRGARAVIRVGEHVVGEFDVKKDWDGDGREVDLRVPPGSTITLVSRNGDPMWVRRLEVDYESDGQRWR
ncbi:MAG: hypothetical protein ACREQQ_13170 [Candidatus Binatia bacterium]